MYIPVVFDDLNELLEVVEQAWKPRKRESNPDELDEYRYDSIMRWAVPSDDDEAYEKVKRSHEHRWGMGPKTYPVSVASRS